MRARTLVLPSMATAALSVLLLVAGLLFPSMPATGGLPRDTDPPSRHSSTQGGSGGTGATAGTKVRVMTFNIRHGTDEEDDLDLESVADDIESAKAQIVGLQEVDRHRSARSDFVDQAKWLAKRLDMHFAFGLNRKTPPQKGHRQPGLHGVAVLSKFPILTARNHMLTNLKYKHRPTKQRSVLETVIDIKGAKISFYSTHLDNQRKEQRLSQMKEILAITAQSGRPSILVGDLNAQPSSRVVGLAKTQFRDIMADLGEGEELTFPYDDPDRRIDYILTRGPIVARWATVIDTGSSDHMPVVAGLTVAKPASKQDAPPMRVEGRSGTVPDSPGPPRIVSRMPVLF
ncbi:endonuclease/exonuclease/phosphatase family protein [Arthrobacter sp. I2-34]|uniref:Endonuclease/exonuclease/phosphatase family protein n=1 Tax=Arthrobacter hankyongi TaxID=2904801 RepID=A0ABS9L6Y2_9MICC|nr:endonuclease/exonuclease/phosphatase family protein [Arthrobacter hankyongi]MCG2622252.1 endonuclease/exonuclease/phosphatase family protein [Arthrobacter hankyongi]